MKPAMTAVPIPTQATIPEAIGANAKRTWKRAIR